MNRFGRVFHPQPLLHQVIASLVIYEMTDKNAQDNGFSAIEEEYTSDSCPFYPSSGSDPSDQRMHCSQLLSKQQTAKTFLQNSSPLHLTSTRSLTLEPGIA
jgi:hypothetical protein